MRLSLLFIFTFLVSITINSLAQAATLTSRVDRNQITQNETLTLTLTYDDTINASELDTSALQQNFDVLSSSPQTSNRVSIVNGKTTREATTSWAITLAPKRQGTLLIPALKLNGQYSQPITITVSNMPVAAAQSQPVEVRVTSNKKRVYPGQQVTINVRLSAADTVNNLQGEPLEIAGADVQLLGQQETQETNNGITRQVVEWRYAVFAEQTGSITIPAQTFTGTVGARRSFFDSFGARGQRVGARSDALTINVSPKPDTQKHSWFPAEQVSIAAQWSTDTAQIRVGEPITRTITIQAQGQRASAIPPLTKADSADYKSYTDQPQLNNQMSATGVTGIRQESSAIIPSNSGELTLPKHTVHWWNTQTKQWQQATLPAETVTVLPSLNNAPTTSVNAQTPTESTRNNTTSLSNNINNRIWQFATLGLGLLCLLQFLLLYKLKKVSGPSGRNTDDLNKNQTNEKHAWNQLQKALGSNNAANTRQQLLNWAHLASGQSDTLQALSKVADDNELSNLLQMLDRHLYKGGDSPNWVELNSKLKTLRKQLINLPQQTNTVQSLKPLYP